MISFELQEELGELLGVILTSYLFENDLGNCVKLLYFINMSTKLD